MLFSSIYHCLAVYRSLVPCPAIRVVLGFDLFYHIATVGHSSKSHILSYVYSMFLCDYVVKKIKCNSPNSHVIFFMFER
jgi:hypothetical protein